MDNHVNDLYKWIATLKERWDSDEFYYDESIAINIFKFASKLQNDRGSNRFFKLEWFQFEIITEILCVKSRITNKRKHREAHINIPRKNGKSFIIAILITFIFFCQPNIFGAQFILTANTTKQASQLFNTILHFIKTNKTLRKYCRIRESTKTITRKDNGNELIVLSSDGDNADSFNDYIACLDEIHQAKNDIMYGKLKTGQDTWEEPLLITITTASDGEDANNLEMQLYTLSKKIEAGEGTDPSFYYKIYEARKDCDILDEKEWFKANPSLGIFKNIDGVRTMAKRCLLMPSQEKMFRRMHLNQHVALDDEKGAINMELWDKCVQKIDIKQLKSLKIWCGLDLSSKNDITGFVIIFYDEVNDKFIVYPFLFTPKDTLMEREKKDGNPYSEWVKKNELIALKGKYINFESVLDKMYDIDNDFEIVQIGFDRWGSQTILNRLEDTWDIVELGQGSRTMTQVINDFENLLIDERLIIADNSCFRFMAKNTIAVYDDAMNVKYSKKKSKFKIDGIVAMLMGLLLAIEENGVSHYDMIGALDDL